LSTPRPGRFTHGKDTDSVRKSFLKVKRNNDTINIVDASLEIQGVSLMVSPSTAYLSHRKPSSARTSRGSCRAQGSDESGTACNAAEK
jgi:hypothetical protein